MNTKKLALLTALVITGAELNCWCTCQEQSGNHNNVIVQPKNATVIEGCSVTMSCVFKTGHKNGSWYRNGATTDIKNRYRYSDTKNNGRYTNDCSMDIANFTYIDEGRWHCSSTHSSQNDEKTMSEVAYLTMVKRNETKRTCQSSTNKGLIFWNITLLLALSTSTIMAMLAMASTIIICTRRRKTGKSAAPIKRGGCVTCIIAPSCFGNCGAQQCDQVLTTGKIKGKILESPRGNTGMPSNQCNCK